MLRLSKSKIETFLHCRYKYHLYYDESLVPKGKTIPLMVGDITHQLLEKKEVMGLTLEDFQNCDLLVKKCYPDQEDAVIQQVAVEAATLVGGYMSHWATDTLKVVGTEVHLEVEYGGVLLYARIDGLCRTQDERLWRLEYKTAGRADSAFLQGLKGDLQTGMSHYILKEVMDEKIHGTMFDLLVKTKVPQYYRNPVPFSPRVVERTLRTVDGVIRSIQGGDFYPSSQCFTYSRACDYKTICDSKMDQVEEVKNRFYERRSV